MHVPLHDAAGALALRHGALAVAVAVPLALAAAVVARAWPAAARR